MKKSEELTEGRKLGGQEGKLFNKSCHPEPCKANRQFCHPDFRPSERAAFTLAEVLITLGIIGIVAAITIPNMMTAYKKHQTVVRLKEAYSIFSRVVRISLDENGGPSAWNQDEYLSFAQNYIIPYMTGVSELKTKYDVKTLNSDSTYIFWQSSRNTQPIYQMNNGMTFTLGTHANQKEFNIVVDLNGFAKPNELGKDVFAFGIRDTNYRGAKFSPLCSGSARSTLMTSDYTACSKTINTASNNAERGACCAALIQNDGWQIRKDYPW